MTTKLRILIAGDLFMQPLAFQEALQEQLADLDYNLEFRTVEFPYPIEGFPLVDYQLPPRLGGGWDDPTDYPESELEGKTFLGPFLNMGQGLIGNSTIILDNILASPPSITFSVVFPDLTFDGMVQDLTQEEVDLVMYDFTESLFSQE